MRCEGHVMFTYVSKAIRDFLHRVEVIQLDWRIRKLKGKIDSPFHVENDSEYM